MLQGDSRRYTPTSQPSAQPQYSPHPPHAPHPPPLQQASSTHPPKQSRSRKKEQPLLQRAISGQNGSKHQERIFAHYTPPGQMMAPHATHQSVPPTSYPAAAPQMARRASGAATYPPPANYRPAMIPSPKTATRSPPAAYARRGTAENVDYMAGGLSDDSMWPGRMLTRLSDLANRQQHPPSRLARNSISRENLRSPAL